MSSPSTVSGDVGGDRDVFYWMFDCRLAPVGSLFPFLHFGQPPHSHWQSLCSWLSHSYQHVFQKLATSSTPTLPNSPPMLMMLACCTVMPCGLYLKKRLIRQVMLFLIIQSLKGLFTCRGIFCTLCLWTATWQRRRWRGCRWRRRRRGCGVWQRCSEYSGGTNIIMSFIGLKVSTGSDQTCNAMIPWTEGGREIVLISCQQKD